MPVLPFCIFLNHISNILSNNSNNETNCDCFPKLATLVFAHNRVVSAIGVHIIAGQALAGGDEGIGVDKSADCGVVITGLEVIEACFSSGIVAIGVVRCGCGGHIIA